ncbi:MAG: hypothetical protein CL912_18870 [Deltaproteobacteria bacterium]|nr:hypothetical protein [Deltaproteobacteria bacterium]
MINEESNKLIIVNFKSCKGEGISSGDVNRLATELGSLTTTSTSVIHATSNLKKELSSDKLSSC